MQISLVKMILDTTKISKNNKLNLIDTLKLIDYSLCFSIMKDLDIEEEELNSLKSVFIEINNLLYFTFQEASNFKAIFDNDKVANNLTLKVLPKFISKRLSYYTDFEPSTLKLFNTIQ